MSFMQPGPGNPDNDYYCLPDEKKHGQHEDEIVAEKEERFTLAFFIKSQQVPLVVQEIAQNTIVPLLQIFQRRGLQ
jgi:hypothetical protein